MTPNFTTLILDDSEFYNFDIDETETQGIVDSRHRHHHARHHRHVIEDSVCPKHPPTRYLTEEGCLFWPRLCDAKGQVPTP